MSEEKIQDMLAVVKDCVEKDKLEFLATILYTLQREYQEVCKLSTDGEYNTTWTHKQVLDHLTYQQKS